MLRLSRKGAVVAVVAIVVVVVVAAGGGWGGDCPNTRDDWGAHGRPSHPGSNKAPADGVENRNGLWMMNYKSCGWNETHTSGYHGKWSCNQSTFKLSSTHVFWSKSGSSAEKIPIPAPSAPTSSVPMGQLSVLISCYKTEIDNGVFASFLLDFKELLK